MNKSVARRRQALHSEGPAVAVGPQNGAKTHGRIAQLVKDRSMAIQKTLMTADELLRLPDDNMRHELVRGELRTMPPAGGEHGFVGAELLACVRQHVRAHDLGFTFNADTGFRIARNP